MVIRIGSTGPAVVALQKILAAHGYMPVIAADGVFGKGTAAAVRQFQAGQGLTADGAVGPNTWARLVTGPGAVYRDALAFLQRDVAAVIKGLPGQVNGAARRALEAASEDVGKVESPNGTNAGPQIAHLVDGYADYWSIPGRPYLAWCVMAVMVWTGKALGLGKNARDMEWKKHPIGGKFLGGAYQIAAWGEKQGVSRPPSEAQPGDIGLMAREDSGSDATVGPASAKIEPGKGHAFLVVEARDGHLLTIEGNIGNAVGVRMRPFSEVELAVAWWKRA